MCPERNTANLEPFRTLAICTGNGASSQIAQGWLNHFGSELVQVKSAGTHPKGVHPVAVQVMAEVEIDLSSDTSDHVDRYLGDDFDLVLTVCDAASGSCPVFKGAKRQLHHDFEDPDKPGISDEALLPVFRQVRDENRVYCRCFLSAEVGINL